MLLKAMSWISRAEADRMGEDPCLGARARFKFGLMLWRFRSYTLHCLCALPYYSTVARLYCIIAHLYAGFAIYYSLHNSCCACPTR